MFAYADMLGQVSEWHDREADSKKNNVNNKKTKVPQPPQPRQGASQEKSAEPFTKQSKNLSSPSERNSRTTSPHNEDVAGQLTHRPDSGAPLSSSARLLPLIIRNVIPLRAAVTPRGRSDREAGVPTSPTRQPSTSPRQPMTAAYLSEEAFRRLCRPRTDFAAKEKQRLLLASPRKSISGDALAADVHISSERRSSVLKMQREYKERQEAARKQPGTIPFNSGGTRNSAWFKHLPVPEHLEVHRKEIEAEREKNGVKVSQEKLVERLYRFPRRPEPKFAPPREPLDEEEEAALVKRLYVVKSYDEEDYEEEDGDEGDEEEIDIDDQVDRLYYQAIVQQKKRREKLESQYWKQIHAMRTPRTNLNTSGRQLLQSSSQRHSSKNSPRNRSSTTNSPVKERQDDDGDAEDDDDATNNKKSEQQLKETFDRLYDKEHYNKRTENAFRKAGYLC